MTPQPRHFDTARDIIDKYHDFRHPLQVEDMARAIAEAENRAAWAGFVAGGPRGVAAYWGNNDNAKEHDEAFEALFGPRPAKENPHA